MLGTDYQLPTGYQLAAGVEQVTNIQVPFGATAGHTVVVEPVQEAVRPTELTVIFETVYGEKVGETEAKQRRQEQETGHSCLEQTISYQQDISLQQE